MEGYYVVRGEIEQSTRTIGRFLVGRGGVCMRSLQAEIEFARRFAEASPGKTAKWPGALSSRRPSMPSKALSGAGGAVDIEKVAAEAEKMLAPIGKAAKEYTIHCCGHAHIDMNWMWPWQETVNVTHDTFTTVDKLMEEFPEFHFSQSQASTYIAMEEYCPEIFEMIKKRVKKGQLGRHREHVGRGRQEHRLRRIALPPHALHPQVS